MPQQTSESTYYKGLQAVQRGNYLEALGCFEDSMRLMQQEGSPDGLPMRYLSYYGLCLAMAGRRLREARQICERAVQAEFYNPDLYLNLGKVYLKAGDRGRAFKALVRGLRLNPRHSELIREIRHLGVRRIPVLRFLRRDHPFNRVLGRLLPRGGLTGGTRSAPRSA